MNTPNDAAPGGIFDHLQRAVIHALGALRCYIALLAAEGERRARRLLNEALWVLVLAGVGVLGVGFFAWGVARWIESRLGAPGSGGMIVGLAILLVFLAAALRRALKKERDS